MHMYMHIYMHMHMRICVCCPATLFFVFGVWFEIQFARSDALDANSVTYVTNS